MTSLFFWITMSKFLISFKKSDLGITRKLIQNSLMNTSSKIDLKSRFLHDIQYIIKILQTLKAISASCDLILMNLDLF